MSIHVLRPGIAMIELIFAITIMGIVMLSIPMIVSTSSKSTYVAIQQESIALASTTINTILGYNWDENNTDISYAPKILVTNSTVTELEGNATAARNGTPPESTRRYADKGGNTGSATIVTSLGSDSGDLDDIDDFSGTTSLTFFAASTVDYADNTITIANTISYISDAITGSYATPAAGGIINFNPSTPSTFSTNIKYIQVTSSSGSAAAELGSTSITLYAFTCNIGSFEEKVKN